MSKPKHKISLVLGSGGARGYAHIGVIRWLEKHDLEIASIVGSSMGALIGGCFAAGKLEEYADWASSIRTTDVMRLLDFTLDKSGFVDGTRIIEVLKEFVGEHAIEELPISYTAVASDIAREKEVWINSGSLFEAIRASIAMPFLFTPAQVAGRALLDGGILNPVPIAPTFSDPTDFTVAVNLNGPADDDLTSVIKNRNEREKTGGRKRTLVERFLDQVQEQFSTQSSEGLNMLKIAQQTMDSMQGSIARSKLAAYPPDVVIDVPQDVAHIMEFDRADGLSELGYQAAEKKMPQFLNRWEQPGEAIASRDEVEQANSEDS